MKYLIGNKQEFLNFLNSIDEKDKVGILTHADLDGISSAILLEEILKSKNQKFEFIDFLNYKKGMFDRPLLNLKGKNINKLFITDIGADDTDLEGFENLRKNFDIFLIDHHKINPDLKNKNNIIKTATEDCTTFTVYGLGKDLFNRKKWRDIVCATMAVEFSYRKPENLKFLQKADPEITLKNIGESSTMKYANKISSALIYYGNLRKVYDLVKEKNLDGLNSIHKLISLEIKKCVEDYRKNAEYFPEKKLYFYYLTPKFRITSAVATIVSLAEENNSFLLASDTGKGFVKISARNQSKNADMSRLMKDGIKGLKNAVGGGHIAAASALVMKKDFNKFKERILIN